MGNRDNGEQWEGGNGDEGITEREGRGFQVGGRGMG